MKDVQGAAIALGNFDGVHRGHQAVIKDAADFARGKHAPLAVATFDPHPRRFFSPDMPPFRLQSDAQQESTLAALGVSYVLRIPFDAALSQLSDQQFAQKILADQLRISHVSVGANFRFGARRVGDVTSLARFGAELGFSVHDVAPVEGEGVVYSSSTIRGAIGKGDMQAAAQMLSRHWAIEGIVQRGFQRGRGFGFATANVALGDYVRPRLGIYAVRVDIGDGAWRPGVASIGVNPTVGALPEPLLEAHLFDFDADLYGRMIEVQLIGFIRDEAKFDDVEALKARMAEDAKEARAILA